MCANLSKHLGELRAAALPLLKNCCPEGIDGMNLLLGLIFPAALIGFVAGLLTFRRASQWCGTCGVTLTCPDPTHHPREAPTTPRRYGRDSARLNAAPKSAGRTPAVGRNQSLQEVHGAGPGPDERVGG
jgi:hypothetical protein